MDRFGGLLPFDPAAVGQCDIFADCTLLLLYDRERTGADVGIVPL